MRRVSRSDVEPPSSLVGTASPGAAEFRRQQDRRALGDAGQKFSAYKGEDVRKRLEELFHGKCAYCESHYSSTAPVDVEHYRPKGAIEGKPDLPGYWWLAAEWSNLLPSCIDCNRRRTQATAVVSSELLPMAQQRSDGIGTRSTKSGKKDAFPIAGTHAEWAPPYSDPMPSLDSEIPLLLNPCDHNPSDYIAFAGSADTLSLVVPVSVPGPAAARGAVSIDVYGLNRLGLVQARTRVLRQLEFLSFLAIRLFRLASDPSINDEMFKKLTLLGDLVVTEMRKMAAPDQSYSMLAVAWLTKFKSDLENAEGE